jgi:ankyrin repeat protein
MANRKKMIVALMVLLAGLVLTGCTVQAPPELTNALRSRNLDEVQSVLEANPKLINSKYKPDGNTLLHWAAQSGNKELVELLVAKGAKINTKNEKFRQTPLHIAVDWNQKDIVEFLVAKGANINSKNKFGATPLPCVIRGGTLYMGNQYDWDIVKFLVANGAKVDVKSNSGYTPLHIAAGFAPIEIVKLYLTKGADVNAKNNSGETPLYSVVGRSEDSPEIVELLISKGANVNAKSVSGDTPLKWANMLKNKKVAELLRKHGAVE